MIKSFLLCLVHHVSCITHKVSKVNFLATSVFLSGREFMENIVVFITASNENEAAGILQGALVEEGLQPV